MKTIYVNQYSKFTGTGYKVLIKDPVIHVAGSQKHYHHKIVIYDLIHKWLRIGNHIIKADLKIRI